MPSNALIYCRVSSDRQATEGHGLDGQERRCRDYAAAHDYRIVQVFRDEGASGGTIDRPALKEMFAYMRKRQDVDIVLFEDVSRIARDMGVHIQILSQITRLGATYQTVNQPIEDTAVGKFLVQSLANVAELHRNLNAQNVRNRMKARLQAGYWVFGSPPGYVFETVAGHGRILVPDHPTATMVRQALEWFAVGRFQTPADVRHFLQEKGLKRRGGIGTVYPDQVLRILTCILYTGFLEFPAWGIPLAKAQHEPLISLDTFERIQERLAKKTALRHDRKDMACDFPLRGFVLCSECRKPYTAGWSRGHGGRYPYYRCNQKGCPMRSKGVRKTLLEVRFDDLLRSVQPQPEVLELVRRAMLGIWNERIQDFQGLIERQQREVEDIDKAIQKYCDKVLATDSALMTKTYEEKIEELNTRKLRMGSRIQVNAAKLREYDFGTALDTVFRFIKDPHQMWKSGKLDLQRTVLRLVFAEPLVYSRKTGFGTATLSLPLAIATACGTDKKQMVHLIGESWNRLEDSIKEWYELLRGRPLLTNGVSPACGPAGT
jgi:site-specific DNA recombinase